MRSCALNRRNFTAQDGAMKFMMWATYVIQAVFFAGLIGCASVVLLSWISILKSGFSDRDEF